MEKKQEDAEEFDSSMIVEAGKKVDEWEMTQQLEKVDPKPRER